MLSQRDLYQHGPTSLIYFINELLTGVSACGRWGEGGMWDPWWDQPWVCILLCPGSLVCPSRTWVMLPILGNEGAEGFPSSFAAPRCNQGQNLWGDGEVGLGGGLQGHWGAVGNPPLVWPHPNCGQQGDQGEKKAGFAQEVGKWKRFVMHQGKGGSGTEQKTSGKGARG